MQIAPNHGKLRVHNTLKLWWRVALWIIFVSRVWKVALSFSNLNFGYVERVTTHYKTLQTWIGHNAMHYHNFNVLPHTIPYIVTQFSMVLGLFAMRYRQIYKKIYIKIFLKKLTVTPATLQLTHISMNMNPSCHCRTRFLSKRHFA